MLERIKENLINLFTSRFLFLYLAFFAMFAALIVRIFDLQIIHGEEYLDDFMLKTEKSREIPSTRGNIYDRNGVLLAYSELAYTVKIEDVYEGTTRATAIPTVLFGSLMITTNTSIRFREPSYSVLKPMFTDMHMLLT